MKHVVHQTRHELHRQILERERRPVKELEHKQTGTELCERGCRRVAEIAVSLARHTREISLRNTVADEGADNLHRNLGVWLSRKTFYRRAIKCRPPLRHIKSAVASQARKHDLDKIKRGGLAPGGHITH